MPRPKALGYEDYSQLSYLRMGRIGYGPEEVARYRRQVVRDRGARHCPEAAGPPHAAGWSVTDPKFYDLGRSILRTATPRPTALRSSCWPGPSRCTMR